MEGAAERLTMDGPVACVIRVQGTLAPQLSDHLGGLRITPVGRTGDPGDPGDPEEETSELRGVLLDQAALRGVLITLNQLRLPLISLICTPSPLAPAGAAGADMGGAPGGDADDRRA